MHIGALCSHETKNNQHNSSTQPRSQPHTMSEGAMANSVAADSAAPARVVAAVTAARAPGGTKKSLPVTAAERVWKTKRPYQRRQKQSSVPVPAPQAAAPAPQAEVEGIMIFANILFAAVIHDKNLHTF